MPHIRLPDGGAVEMQPFVGLTESEQALVTPGLPIFCSHERIESFGWEVLTGTSQPLPRPNNGATTDLPIAEKMAVAGLSVPKAPWQL